MDFAALIKKWAVIKLGMAHPGWTQQQKDTLASELVDRIAKDLVDTRMTMDAWARGDTIDEGE